MGLSLAPALFPPPRLPEPVLPLRLRSAPGRGSVRLSSLRLLLRVLFYNCLPLKTRNGVNISPGGPRRPPPPPVSVSTMQPPPRHPRLSTQQRPWPWFPPAAWGLAGLVLREWTAGFISVRGSPRHQKAGWRKSPKNVGAGAVTNDTNASWPRGNGPNFCVL